jgi:predicted GH43/DUF377 family glycosyl hydrolase
MIQLTLILILACSSVSVLSLSVRVTTTRQNNASPIGLVSSSLYNYNPSYVAPFAGFINGGLLVRAQNLTAHAKSPFDVGASSIDFAPRTGMFRFGPSVTVLSANGSLENYGVEDPRVVIDQNGTYYLLYSAVEQNATAITSRLALATSRTPQIAASWKRHGVLFSFWSKSGSLLIRDAPPHYLFFGDSSLVPGLQWATAPTPAGPWTLQNGLFLKVRANSFDTDLVEAGPEPMLLASGNYFFVYNSAQRGHKSVKPGYDFQYNCGWAILNGSDPSQVLLRGDNPLLSPKLAWELGTPPSLDLTPNVVFCEGIEQVGTNRFWIYYGAADSVIGVAEVNVIES